jgi:hypothetical protein
MKKILLFLIVIAILGSLIWLIFKIKGGSSNITQKNIKDPFEQGFDKEAANSDPFNDPNGPWYHKVKLATSNDGIIFKDTGRTILDKASVPDAIKLADGTILIYAVDGAKRSNSQMLVARSKDAGKTWQEASVKLTSKRKDAQGADPDALLLPDGRIRLFYIVFPVDENGKILSQEKNSVYGAFSKDGVNFEEDSEPVFQESGVTDPDVIKIGNQWFEYLSQGQKEILAKSDDGSKFQFDQIIRENGSVSNTVEVEKGEFRQFFCKSGISSASSTDGISWKDEVISLPGDGRVICDPAPVNIDGQWYLFYKEAVSSQKQNNPNFAT